MPVDVSSHVEFYGALLGSGVPRGTLGSPRPTQRNVNSLRSGSGRSEEYGRSPDWLTRAWLPPPVGRQHGAVRGGLLPVLQDGNLARWYCLDGRRAGLLGLVRVSKEE
jgi:hypothetical protein